MKNKKGIIGITLAVIMITLIFAAIAPPVSAPSALAVLALQKTTIDCATLVETPLASYYVGDTVCYKMVITNPDPSYGCTLDVSDTYSNGTVELLEDDLYLGIGENKTYFRSYVVTAADGGAGYVTNILSVTGTNDNGQGISASVGETSTILSNPPEFALTFVGIGCLEVEFDGSASTDDGSIVNHTWYYGDGQDSGVISGAPTTITHNYSTCGVKTVKLEGYDDEGNYNSTTDVIYVDCGPTAIARATPACFEGTGSLVEFNGGLSHADLANTYDPQTIVSYQWTFSDNVAGSSDNTAVTSRMVNDTVTATLTVTDSLGCEDTGNVMIELCSPVPPEGITIDDYYNMAAHGGDGIPWISFDEVMNAVMDYLTDSGPFAPGSDPYFNKNDLLDYILDYLLAQDPVSDDVCKVYGVDDFPPSISPIADYYNMPSHGGDGIPWISSDEVIHAVMDYLNEAGPFAQGSDPHFTKNDLLSYIIDYLVCGAGGDSYSVSVGILKIYGEKDAQSEITISEYYDLASHGGDADGWIDTLEVVNAIMDYLVEEGPFGSGMFNRDDLIFHLVYILYECQFSDTIYVPDDYTKIQWAVDNASAGDTIIVRDGNYTENVNVNKPHLTIRSENGSANCIVQAADLNDHVFEVTASYVNICGFTVKNANIYKAGISLNHVNHSKIFNITALNNWAGIYLYESSNNTITNNNASNNIASGINFGTGIYLSSSSNNNIIINNNAVNNKKDGIYLWTLSNNNVITNNSVLHNNGCGIHLCGSCNNNDITNNTAFNNSYFGIHLWWSSHNSIIKNNILNNRRDGLYLDCSSNNNIYINNLLNNDNIFSYNSTNIWNSTSPMTYSYNGSTYTNYLGNYWDDYSDTDSDGDGIWDNPYSIDSDQDYYPLKERFENYVEDDLLEVLFFSQRDPAWSDKKLDHSPYSIGEYGCALTSAAMVAKYFGYDTDPDRLNASLTEIGGLDITGDLHWEKVEEVSCGKVTWIESVGATWSRIDQELSNENPVISSVNCSLGNHFIVFIGKIENEYYFLDPYDETQTLNKWPNGAHGEYTLKNLKIYYGIAQKPPKPVITSPLEITPKEVYYVGDTLTANFTITNRGTESINFDVLVVGGRDPAGEVVDFDKAYDITLNQGDSYNYQGSVTLPDKLGFYHFFCAYHTEEHMPGEDDYNWNTNIDVEINGEIVEDFNEAQMYRVRAIIVFDESYISPAPPPAVWEKIDGPWDSWPKRKEPLEIAVNPNDPDEIYVSAILQWGNLGEQAGGKLYKSTDGGGSWNPINQGLPQFGDFYRPIRAIAISPSNPDIVYVGTSTLQPYSSNSAKFGAGGIYKSTNGGLEWAAVNGPCKILPGVYYPISSMIVDPTNSDIVYIGTVGGGIWRTTNGGSSYEKIWDESGETLLDVISLAISPADHSIIYAAAYNFKPLCTMGWSSVLIQNRLIKFKDGGNTWETLLRSRLSPYPKIEDIVVDYKNADIVYVITQTFDVYKIDGGENLYDVSGNAGSDPLPNPYISGPEVGRSNSIAMDPRFSNVIYAARRGEGVYLSPNSGDNWFPIGLQEGHWLKNLVFATNADTHVIYAASTELHKLDISNSAIVISGHCPMELRVYDSEGRITGLVNGEIKEEIPNSGYINNTAMIFSPNISYRYEVVGTDNGTYGLSMVSVENENDTDFFISNISTQTNATHEYTVNWTILSQGGAGVTLKIDADGDGEFEKTITIQPPIANFTYTPENPVINQTITFDASNSTDIDGNITSYKWDFGDETNGTGEKPSHSYSSAGNYIVTLTVRDDDGATTSTSKTITIYPPIFDTDSPANQYPSIMGNHTGTIKPNHTVIATKLYTYPCPGTGGHTEYAKIENKTWNATATWEGYVEDWHNITFDKPVVLLANETYNYTIHTGSYPQIIHEQNHTTLDGSYINCTEFVDVNGKKHNNWIPAIRLCI